MDGLLLLKEKRLMSLRRDWLAVWALSGQPKRPRLLIQPLLAKVARISGGIEGAQGVEVRMTMEIIEDRMI